MLPSVSTHSSFSKSVVMLVVVSKVGVVLCRALSDKSMVRYITISTNVTGTCYQIHCDLLPQSPVSLWRYDIRIESHLLQKIVISIWFDFPKKNRVFNLDVDNYHITMHQCMVHATQFNSCCATKLSTLFLLSYGHNRPELNSVDLQDLDSLQQYKYELQVNKIEEIKQWLVELWKSCNTAFEWNMIFVFLVSQVVQKH